MDLGLSGKKAVVTGATRGIGRAIAETLAGEGVDIAICARHEDQVKDVVAALHKKGVQVTGAAVDVADKAAYQAWIESAGRELGGIDIFVPNVSAGGGSTDESGWVNNFNVDLLGTTRGIEAAMPFLEQSGEGSIVVIGSVAAVEDFMLPQTYNAIKAALIVHAQQLALTVAGKGIRVNCVSPGPVFIEGGDWDFIKNNLPQVYEASLAKIPRGTLGTAQEVANAVVFLASPAASLITGVNLVADAGFTKRVQL